ncbi:MAG: GYF domain-containing protein [Bacteroidales bacterium]|nr:GYF domain-containing protein [Bacteroidales bacterium]MCI7645996.1 GYF domain-containing protein [Bacteroidales bacterium]
MLTNIFYLSPTREKKGPVNEDQLKAANISPDTLVWMPGLSAWTPAKQVPQIAALLPQPEPAPAPAPAPAPKPAPVQPQVVITQPVQPQVAKPQPVQPQVVNTQPVQPQVVNTQPVQPQVVNTQPVQPQPVYAQPQVVNTQPINVQPVDENYSVERPHEASAERVPFNAAGMTGMVLALLSLLNWIPVVGFVLGWIVALVFSIVGLCRPKKGMAITGLILCLIILIIVILVITSSPRWLIKMF